MALSAPLAITVEIALNSGPAGGQRRFRLSREIIAPNELFFAAPLPIEGEGEGRATFSLPGGATVDADAILRFDPEYPERGSTLSLMGLKSTELEAILNYIETRNES